MDFKWFSIFRKGRFKDSQGRVFEATEEKLNEIVRVNNGQERPLVIGHPEVSSPAWGQANAFKREGGIVYAKPNYLIPKFQEWVKKKLWDRISISLRPDMTIRHIGFLGAAPPAIQGIPAFEFGEDGVKTITLDFAAENDNALLLEREGRSVEERVTKLIDQKLEENKNLPYSKAFLEVQKENPDLIAEYIKEVRPKF
jgi:hypothetical protein